LTPDTRKKRRLQRKMDRQRRANNPDNFDEKGHVKTGRIAQVGTTITIEP
jgi:hypothetical protein